MNFCDVHVPSYHFMSRQSPSTLYIVITFDKLFVHEQHQYTRYARLSTQNLQVCMVDAECEMLTACVCDRLLAETKGSLLEDVSLLNTLETSKVTSQEVTEQLATSETTEVKIDAAREVSRIVLRGSNCELL